MTRIWLLTLLVACALRAADAPFPAPQLPAQLEQPPERPGLVIRSDEAEAVLRSNVVHYIGNVMVYDPPAKEGGLPTMLRCDALTALRGTNGRLETIIADGNVIMMQEELSAIGRNAIYTASTEQIVLSGAYQRLDALASDLQSLRPDAAVNETTNFAAKLGAFLRTNALPILISTRTNSPATTAASNIVYSRITGRLAMKGGVVTDLPATTLRSSSTNANPPRSPFTP